MSRYSVELRRVCETFTKDEVKKWFTAYELSDYLTPEEIEVVNTRNTFDKNKLADQIIDTYWLREIGTETVGLFKRNARLKMRQIMGKYAQIIYSASIKINPLVNEDYTETFNRSTNTEGESNSNSNGSGFGLTSDTPQSRMNKSDLMAGKYATTATGDETTTNGTTTANGKETEEYSRTLRGNRGISSNAPYLIQQYRDYIIPIYDEIIEEVGEIFMGIY